MKVDVELTDIASRTVDAPSARSGAATAEARATAKVFAELGAAPAVTAAARFRGGGRALPRSVTELFERIGVSAVHAHAAAVAARKLRACCCGCSCCCVFNWLATAAVAVLVALWLGSEVERARVAAAPGTDWFYATPQSCAAVGARAPATYPNATAAQDAGALVRHCGACGACSTVRDIDIYNRTRNSLTGTATACALESFFGGRRGVATCYRDEVGFSRGCRACWVDNVLCDRRDCLWTCLRYVVFRERNNGRGGTLNPCLECDEKLCGPAFTRCAGANRRRSGIATDIGRDEPAELCDRVDRGWPRAARGGGGS